MRRLLPLALACLTAAAVPRQFPSEPFVPMSVSYSGAVRPPLTARDPAVERDAWRRDLATIRSLGFNSIRTSIDWASAEPERGRYRFDALDQLLTLADAARLKVIVQISTEPSPGWVAGRAPDAAAERARGEWIGGACVDPPGVAAGLTAFIGQVTSRAASHRSFHAVDACCCPQTTIDRHASPVVPKPAEATPWSPVRLAAALDASRALSRGRGWSATLQSGQSKSGARVGEPVTGSDLRLWGWAALAHGAQAISYDAWYPAVTGPDAGVSGLLDPDGAVTARATAAGEFAGVVARNASLFAPLRPRPSHVGIVYDQLADLTGGSRLAPSGALARDSRLGIYRALFDGNVQADFVHADDLVAGRAATYGVLYLGDPLVVSRELARALEAYVREGGTLISEVSPSSGLDDILGRRELELRRSAGRPGEPAIVTTNYGKGRGVLVDGSPSAAFERDPRGASGNGVLLRQLVALARVAPDVAIDGPPGAVEARFLESADALLFVAINHAESPQKVTFRFAPEVPEAIWQNMESGASVSFVQGPNGPVYTRSFAARDAMVLVRGKRLR